MGVGVDLKPAARERWFLAHSALDRRPSETKVEHSHPPVSGNQNIFGLKIAMDKTRSMGGLQPLTCGKKTIEHLSPGSRSAHQPCAQADPDHQLHGDKDLLADDSDVVHMDHIWMGQASH